MKIRPLSKNIYRYFINIHDLFPETRGVLTECDCNIIYFNNRNFVEEKMGSKYTENRSVEFAKSYEESGPATPVFFILSPGVDPLKDVEALGKKLGFSMDNGKFHNISLGQGQEIVAEQAMDLAAKEGHWVVLQVSKNFIRILVK